MRLVVAVLPPHGVAPPPGIDPAAYLAALREDTYDTADDLLGVDAMLAADEASAWAAMDADIGAVVAGDVPDLPGLLIAKLLGACEDKPAGVLPARDGRLVGIAARLPVPAWVGGLTLEDGLDAVHARAPRGSVVVGPGWRRLRHPEDVRTLDPRLEGWPRTRGLLGS